MTKGVMNRLGLAASLARKASSGFGRKGSQHELAAKELSGDRGTDFARRGNRLGKSLRKEDEEHRESQERDGSKAATKKAPRRKARPAQAIDA
jgi:hypothetical protein